MISWLKTGALIGLLFIIFVGCGKTPSAVRVSPEPSNEFSALEPDRAQLTIARRIEDIRAGSPAPGIFKALEPELEPELKPAIHEDPKPVDETKPLIHKVKWKMETLFSIAHWYTGSGRNWRQLVDANPDIQPHRIHIGDMVRIPENLLERCEPMPEEFLKPVRKKPPAGQPKPSRSPVKTRSPRLFGPVGSESEPVLKQTNELPVPLETID